MRKTRIIGWGDIPSFAFYEANLDAYVNTGFDGILFAPVDGGGNQIYVNVWGPTPLPVVDRLWKDLPAPPANNLAHNYIRANALYNINPTVFIDWFDAAGYAIIIDNMVEIARLARASFCRGIILDNETYGQKFFRYLSQPEQGLHTFSEYVTQVRAVATAMGTAMWAAFPACNFFLANNYWTDVADTGHTQEDRQQGLLSAFLDGILDSMAGHPCVTYTSGNEFSYGCKAPDTSCFAYVIRNTFTNIDYAGITGSSAEFAAHTKAAVATNMAHVPYNNATPNANYFTPTGLTDTLILASQYTDRYVWVYSEGYGWVRDAGSGIINPAYADSILNALPFVD